jgi:hypothetical protein
VHHKGTYYFVATYNRTCIQGEFTEIWPVKIGGKVKILTQPCCGLSHSKERHSLLEIKDYSLIRDLLCSLCNAWQFGTTVM